MYRLNINKAAIPYRFEVVIANVRYQWEIRYNDMFDFFTADLSAGGELLVVGEPLVYGSPLFQSIADERFPRFTITPLDPSGIVETVTWGTLQETVFLEVEP
ncbi:phage baseplate plug family protein [Paenibacillus sp. S-38]|uniref:phage baseplate plug family protein n=1 Tax=Paenibacillus sp. S-38 TaxID=3416710 RepID=UPI003CE97EFC